MTARIVTKKRLVCFLKDTFEEIYFLNHLLDLIFLRTDFK